MCGPAWPLCLLLCFIVSALTSTLGVVIAPTALTIEVGQPLTLSCNITITGAGDTIHQVRWLNKHKHTLLAYEPSSPVLISRQDPNVHLASSHDGASYITIKAVRPEDEGCYHCIFDVFPKGQQEGKTCIRVTGKVDHKGNRTAVAGTPTTLSCTYTLPEKVHQVLWTKTSKRGDSTPVASYSSGHENIVEKFMGRVTLNKNLGDAKLTIREVKVEDEACYTCDFHTYPDGTRSATDCLSVYVLPKPEVSYVTLPSGVIQANCSAKSRPSAGITWNVGGDNLTVGPPVYSSYDQSDGTTVMTSAVWVKSGALLSDVKCIVHHRGLDAPLTVPLANMGPAMLVLVSVCGVAAVLLLCLCGCLCKCFVCNDD